MTKKLTQQQITVQQFQALTEGREQGLDFFYRKYASYLLIRATRATKNQCPAESIVQEAFLRLWLCRNHLKNETDVFPFLTSQVKSAIRIFYSKTREKFQRGLLSLEDMFNYAEYLHAYDPEADADQEQSDTIYLENREREDKEMLDRLYGLLPNINQEQQLFIRLCLKYNFDYERIAYYLGGISDYEVSMKVEKAINQLRQVIFSTEKMAAVALSTQELAHDAFTEQQSRIFHMRYELQLSFDDILQAMQLSVEVVSKLFIHAHTIIKKSKQIA